jgi:hypothetical protein
MFLCLRNVDPDVVGSAKCFRDLVDCNLLSDTENCQVICSDSLAKGIDVSPQRIPSHDIAAPSIYRFHDSRALHANIVLQCRDMTSLTTSPSPATSHGRKVLKVIPISLVSPASSPLRSVPVPIQEDPNEGV